MTIPQWTLLGFAAWTLALLMATVGVYRWGLILFAKAGIASFPPEAREGAGWYQRGTRAHANCIENLPVFGAIVYLITAIGLEGPMVDALCIATLAARIVQSCEMCTQDWTMRDARMAMQSESTIGPCSPMVEIT